jgi:two-component system, chemotaxis family, CheB/CheR fusion protein
MQNAPIGRLDLLACRNTLMYFNAEVQSQILNRFHFALNDGGHLFLGKAETLLTRSDRFKPVNLKLRVFTPVLDGGKPFAIRERSAAAHHGDGSDLRDAALSESSVAMVVIDAEHRVRYASRPARSLFGLTLADIGVLLQDLRFSYQPAELRSLILESNTERRTVEQRGVEWHSSDDADMVFDVEVTPLFDLEGGLVGTSVTFHDVSRFRQLEAELQQSNRELASAYEELQSTNEELETTNEELQSTNEELETTNEELQSTNEELETTNEELQSTNDELQATNIVLGERSSELTRVNTFLEAILAGLQRAVAVVDVHRAVQAWNSWAEDMWGLRADEVQHQNFLELDIGLPVDGLADLVARCLDGRSRQDTVLMAARNRRGRDFTCRVLVSPLTARDIVQGAVIVMEDADRSATS